MRKKIHAFFLIIIIIISRTLFVYAEELSQTEKAALLPVESNAIENWAVGPELGAQSAILMDAENGAILYSKNIHERLYPASTTKIMTAMLAIENSYMSDIVSFSDNAVFGIERTSSNIGIDVGEEMTMEECLYGILLGSANEVCMAVAEHVAGSVDAFVDMMNARAVTIGCQNTHFANPHGLPDDDHYTSAYDLALIAKEFFSNENVARISGTTNYTIMPTPKQKDKIDLVNHHTMLPGLTYQYEYVVGGKTGYTVAARSTLVTCAEKNGMRLICIILKEEPPYQFKDTISLFNYGFDNFQKLSITDHEKNYTIDGDNFFQTQNNVFGTSKTVLSLNPNGYIIIPKTSEFSEAVPQVSYDTASDNSVASLIYSFHGNYVGETTIDFTSNEVKTFAFGEASSDNFTVPRDEKMKNVIFIDIHLIFICIGALLGLSILIVVIKAMVNSFNLPFSKKARYRKNKYRSKYDKIHF